MANSENALTNTNAATPATELDALSIEQLTDQVLKVLITNVEAVTNEIYGNKNK